MLLRTKYLDIDMGGSGLFIELPEFGFALHIIRGDSRLWGRYVTPLVDGYHKVIAIGTYRLEIYKNKKVQMDVTEDA